MKGGFYAILFLFAFFLSNSGLTAQSITFTAESDARQVTLSGYFKVSFSLKNAEGSNFEPPSFKDFEVLNGPSRSMSTSIYNGQRSSELTISYLLQPKALGRFSIGSASIRANGKKLTSTPISIQVVKGREKVDEDGQPIEEDVFVRMEIDTVAGYVGQQLILDYKLYTTINIANYNIRSESEYDGCFVQNVRTYNNRATREIIDGVQYTTQILKRVALFPQQNGLIKIEPAKIQLGISTGRSSSFFFSNTVKPRFVQTNGLEISISTLPTDSPPFFTGAVGRYQVSASINPTQATTDDALALKISILGDGDLKRVQAPGLISPFTENGDDAFEIYEPTLQNDATYENGGKIEGRKDFEYLLLPKHPGTYIIQPQFAYFNPDSAQYIALNNYRFAVSIGQGKGISQNNALTDNSIAKDQIKPYIPNVSVAKTGALWITKTWYWVIYGLPILGFLGLFGFQEWQARRADIDPEVIARRKAEKVAIKKLAAAESFMKDGQATSYYNEISHAYIGYVQDKLSIKTADLTKSNVRSHLANLGVTQNTQDGFMEILDQTESNLYSGRTNDADMQSFYNKAVDILARVEREIAGD